MENYIVTISRRFASKGHEIASLTGGMLGIPVYDRSAVEAMVQSLQTEGRSQEDMSLAKEYASDQAGADSVHTGSGSLRIKSENMRGRNDSGARGLLKGLLRLDVRDEGPDEAQIEFDRQSEVIRNLAAEGPCIILGRCADQIFETHPRALHVFIYAGEEDRVRNVIRMLHTSEEAARSMLQSEDRSRDEYRRRFSAHPMDEVAGRHILLDSGKLGAGTCARLLAEAVRQLYL